ESGEDELDDWIEVVVTGFAHPDEQGVASHEEFPREIVERAERDLVAAGARTYLALRDGVVAGGGGLRITNGVAQLVGAATAPEFRRQGVQTALLSTRLADAAAAGCDIAVVTTAPGSKSQQNVQRQGFHLLYTRAVLVKGFGIFVPERTYCIGVARPRTFDEHEVVAAARDKFWERGYAATSVDDLTAATGLGKGSLYGAFGDKHTLYLRALDDYISSSLGEVRASLRDPKRSAYERLAGHIRGQAKALVADKDRRGCLMAKSAAELGATDDAVEKKVELAY